MSNSLDSQGVKKAIIAPFEKTTSWMSSSHRIVRTRVLLPQAKNLEFLWVLTTPTIGNYHCGQRFRNVSGSRLWCRPARQKHLAARQ